MITKELIERINQMLEKANINQLELIQQIVRSIVTA